jgi:hypothetical protein
MLKTAYIFHGHARKWQLCHQNFFDNVFSVLPGDIFIHTWDTTNSNFGSWWAHYRDFTEEEKVIADQTPDFNEIYGIYKPKVLLIEKDKGKDLTNMTNHKKSSIGTQYMLEGSRKIFEIACEYNDYDIFFSTRMDLNYTTKLNISEYEDGVLMSPEPLLPYDIWMYGNKELMDIKTKYASHIEQYFFNVGISSLGGSGYEVALGNYLRDNNIKLKKSDLQCHTVRVF